MATLLVSIAFKDLGDAGVSPSMLKIMLTFLAMPILNYNPEGYAKYNAYLTLHRYAIYRTQVECKENLEGPMYVCSGETESSYVRMLCPASPGYYCRQPLVVAKDED